MERELITEQLMTFEQSKELLGEWPSHEHIVHWFDPQVDTKYVFETPIDETVIAGIKRVCILAINIRRLKNVYLVLMILRL